MNRIVVELADPQWTTYAMHFASAMARNTGGDVVLLQMLPVSNPAALGAGFEGLPHGAEAYRRVRDYAAIAKDYGVELCVQRMEYLTRFDALAQAVETLEASVLFAPIAETRFAFWRRLMTWGLARRLRNCRLYTLAQTDAETDEPTQAIALAMPKHARA